MRILGTTDLQQLLEARALLRTANQQAVGPAAEGETPSVQPFAPVHLSPEARARLAIQALSGLTPAQFNQAFIEMADAGILESLFQFKLDDPGLRTLLDAVAKVLGPSKATAFMALLDAPELGPPAGETGGNPIPPSGKAPVSAEIVELAKLLSRELTQLAPQAREKNSELTRGNILRAEPLRHAGNLAAVLFGGAPAIEENPPPAATPAVANRPLPLPTLIPTLLDQSEAAVINVPAEETLPPAPTAQPTRREIGQRGDPVSLLRELVAVTTPEVLPASRGEVVRLLRYLASTASPAAEPDAEMEQAYEIVFRATPETKAAIERMIRPGTEKLVEITAESAEEIAVRILTKPESREKTEFKAAASETLKAESAAANRSESPRTIDARKDDLAGSQEKPKVQAPNESAPQEIRRAHAELRNSIVEKSATDLPGDRSASEMRADPRVDRNDIPVPIHLHAPRAADANKVGIRSDLVESGEHDLEIPFVPIPREKAMLPRPPAPLPATRADVRPRVWHASFEMVEQLILPLPVQ